MMSVGESGTHADGPRILTTACSRHREAPFVVFRQNAVQLPDAAEARR